MKKIKLEKCSHCGNEPVIYSNGGVNCPECFQHIRMLTPKEKKIHQKDIKKMIGMYKIIKDIEQNE